MKAVILAAGIGERMRPLTSTRPKVMLPIKGKPFLDYVLESLKESGIEEATIVVGYRKEDIINRYADGKEFGIKIEYVEQKEQKGTAHAVSFTENNDTFVLINGDVYCDSNSLTDIIKFHKENNSKATVGTYKVENAASYGVIKTKKQKIKKIVEKPEETYNQPINAGIYVFEPPIYNAIEETPLSKREEKEITTSIEILIENGESVYVKEIDSWTHIGNPWDLLDTNKRALDNHKVENKGKVESGAYLDGKVNVEEGALIRAGAYIEGPVNIGKNSDIGPNCYIRPFTSIGKNVRIGNAVEVKNSIIMDGTHAAHHTYIGDSIIGKNCNFGSGTKIGNLRLDKGNITMNLRGELENTGKRKLGTVLGDNVQTGINSMINPGVKAGPNSAIGPGTILYEDLPENKCIFAKQEVKRKSWKND